MTETASATPIYVCIFRRGRPRIGWLEGGMGVGGVGRSNVGKSRAVRLSDGSTLRIPPQGCHYCWPGEPTDGSPEAALAQLAYRELELDAQWPYLDALHRSITPGAPMPFDAVLHKALPGNRDSWARGLLFWALLMDRLRFQFLSDPEPAFLAREEAEVERLQARETGRREEAAWVEQAGIWRAQLETGEWRPEAPDDAGVFLGQLRSMLVLEKESSHWRNLAKPLGLDGLTSPDRGVRLKTWLHTAGAWPGWPAIWLERAGVETVFDTCCLEAAQEMAQKMVQEIAPHPVRSEGRTDYREESTYTIDSTATLDFDDAISILEHSAREMTVAVHIAEPPEMLLPGHPLFDEAERRMATAYTLDGIFPMFPEDLSNGRFSLLRGQEREVVSHVFRIGEGGAKLERIERGLVCVRENLDFVKAEKLIEDHPASWGRLALLCAGLRDARAEKGAVIQTRHELALDVSNPAEIQVSEITRQGPVHQMVEELAVLANGKAAEILTAAGVPAIFRVQESTDFEIQVPGRDYYPPASFTTQPAPHHGLGCAVYMQITSPIRRFPDLVMQRQLIGHLAGGERVFGDPALLENWCARAERKMAAIHQAARAIQHDYLRRYLQQNPGLELKGRVRKRHSSQPGKIWLERLEMLARCELPPGLGDGDPVSVRMESVDLDRQTLSVTCLGKSPL